jgi:hypothetical protein
MTVIVLAHLFPSPVDSYASWLKCYIELDQDEIVMHHPMVPPQDARHEAFIQVQPYGSSEWIAAEEHTLGRGLKATRDPDDSTFVNTLKVRLQVPEHLEMMNEEVQFVVEARGENVAFMDVGVQCDGTRAFSRRHDEHVVLQINSTATTSSSSSNVVELMAGWAAGYEAVTLTRIMTLKRSPVGVDANQEEL